MLWEGFCHPQPYNANHGDQSISVSLSLFAGMTSISALQLRGNLWGGLAFLLLECEEASHQCRHCNLHPQSLIPYETL